MARINYFDIASEVKTVLTNDSDLAGVQVTVENDPPLDGGPWVAVYVDSRTPTAGQPLAAGTRTRMSLRISLWCWQFSLDSVGVASQGRDDLIGKVEIALMKNRTLNGKVSFSWLEGGSLLSDRVQTDSLGGYIAGGEVVLVGEAIASY